MKLSMADEALVKDFEDKYGVTRVPLGQSTYGSCTGRKSRLLFERHERTRQMYRDLVTYGFDKWEIAKLMQVSTAQVRKSVNAIGMINKLKGHGDTLADT